MSEKEEESQELEEADHNDHQEDSSFLDFTRRDFFKLAAVGATALGLSNVGTAKSETKLPDEIDIEKIFAPEEDPFEILKEESKKKILSFDPEKQTFNLHDNSINKVSSLQRSVNIPNPSNQVKLRQSDELPSWNKYSGNPIINEHSASIAPNGIGFHSVIKASRFLGSPEDNYYMYAAGHNSDGIFLYTAPDPLGSWSLYSSTPLFDFNDVSWANDQMGSPQVIWNKETSEMWVYWHSKTIDANGPQPTGLSKSSDGLTSWTHESSPVIDVGDHRYRWNGNAASYADIIKTGNYFLATMQSNSITNNIEAGGVTTNVGIAYSRNGTEWTTAHHPLMSNISGTRGPFGPSLRPWNDKFLITYEKYPDHDIYAVLSNDLQPGEYTEPELFLQHSGAGVESSRVCMPELFYDDGTLYLYYHAADSNYAYINVATAEWS